MQISTLPAPPKAFDGQGLGVAEWIALVLEKDTLLQEKDATIAALQQQVAHLSQRIDWFARQLFGQKSERLPPGPDPAQLNLGELLGESSAPPPEQEKHIPAHTRRVRPRDRGESLPVFDEARLPVQTIEVPNPDIQGLSEDQYEVIDHKITWKLAQRPGSYVVLKYVRPVIKRHQEQTVSCPPAPAGVLEDCRADVSFCAGLLMDKFAWHLPFHRIHQRLRDAGVNVSRPWLTQLAQQIIALLEPIHVAQFDSIRSGRVVAMDETPIKAGRKGDGSMKTGYFWPVFGEHDEVCFPFFASRKNQCVIDLLGLSPPQGRVLLSDGYAAYARYAQITGATHAQCWAHTRRKFFEARDADPGGAAQALEQIGQLYRVESTIRDKSWCGETKRLYRLEHGKPIVEAFFAWVEERLTSTALTPSNRFTKALAYARERRLGLEVHLTDADVPLDTNHLERALRAIPMGRNNWLFCWTEMGAKQAGIVQSLIVTCRLHGIDPYAYLVDVLQRVGQHPASRVAELTPRLWKQHFAADPLRSELDLRR